MSLINDPSTLGLIGAIVGLLGLATGTGQILKRQTDPRFDPAVIEQFNHRVRAWWLLLSVLAAAFLLGQTATVVLFGLLSFWALREFITLTPTRAADHRALFWVFVLFTPLQYVLVGMNWYGLYTILIPVYAFLFVPVRVALAGDYKRYLERCAKIQSGLMICVYCLSHAPALLNLARPVPSGATAADVSAQNAGLLLFFIVVVTMGDAFHYAAEQLVGRRIIAPAISANRTWEGFLAAVGCGTLFGAALWWATPFNPWAAAGMSLLITTMGFCGGLVMSAIKRDRGVQDYGTLVVGHGGVLDRIDSVCFAAPVFFHVTQYVLQYL
ncbi:MAG: phosphatidate cytidylyltransferase [Planctomycetia bacterium]|nr:phosphatidate cytidylyltransferase [Planctomycetia bacterium]